MARSLVMAAALLAMLRAQQPDAAPADPVAQQRAAVAAAETAHGADSVEVAAQLVKLGQLLTARESFAEALPVHRRALAIRETRLPADSPQTDVARVNVASALIALDDPAAAVPVLRAVCAAGASRAPSRLTAGALTNLGVACCKLGDYAAADEHLVAAIAMFRAHFADHPFLSIALQNLAQLRLNQGRVEEARQLLTEVVAGVERADPSGPRHAQALFGLGIALARAERLDDATQYLHDAQTMLATRLPVAHPQRRELEYRLGWLCCQRGELAAARDHLQASIGDDDDPPSTAELRRHVTLARTLLRLGESDVARRHHTRAERLAAALAVPAVQCVDLGFLRAELAAAAGDSPAAIAAWRQLVTAVELVDPETALTARSSLARALREHGEHAAAVTELLANLRSFGSAVERVLPAMLEAERLRYVAQNRSDLDLLLDYLATRPELLDAARAYAAVVAWKGQVARGVQDGIAQARGNPDHLARLRRLRELASDEAQGRGGPTARSERERLLAALAPERADAPPVAIDAAAVQAALGADEALLDYVLWRRTDGTEQLLAFVVTDRQVVPRQLGAADAVAQLVGRHLLMTSRSVEPGAAALARDDARRARDAVFSPLLEPLGGRTRLWVSGDGVLATLPFETLPAEGDDRYLIEQFRIDHLQSAAQLCATTDAAQDEHVVAFGAIDYGDGQAADEAAPRGAARRFAALPQTEVELRGIAAAAGATPCVVVRDREADEVRLRELAPTATVLHLATHGFYGGNGPGDAGVALAGANEHSGDDDGVLTAAEAALLDLGRCRVVVLSSCQSGLGQPVAGESVLGLRRGLLQAGARCTVTSMWPVGDRATAQLMSDFYARLLTAHEPPGTALRHAQLQALARARAEHGEGLPGRWGAFVCEGR